MNILIIGDWTIDQNWICGLHRSSISSRTGRMHLRGLNQKDGATEALCGAGATASVLCRAKHYDKSLDYKIIGLGIWHIHDTDVLTDMIFSAHDRELQPSGRYARLIPKGGSKKMNVELINIADYLKLKNDVGTTRIVRIYQHTGSKVDLLSRIDWENALPDKKPYWILGNDASSIVEKVKNYLPLHAVVIKCLNKRVVSFKLIEKLVENKEIRGLPWYISTKDWEPKWLDPEKLELIKEVNCRMLLIPEMAVNTAKRKSDTTKWINSKGFGTQAALSKIEKFRLRFKSKPTVIVLPSGHRILSVGPGKISTDRRGNEGEDINDLLVVQNERDTFTKPMAIETPFASIFLGAYIVQDLYHIEHFSENNTKSTLDTREVLEKAVATTKEYIRSENSRVLYPEKWDPKESEVHFDLSKSVIPDGKFDWRNDLSLTEAIERWGMATAKLGIIKKDGSKFIELFRAATEVDDYICLDPDKKNSLQRLIIELKEFKTGNRDESSSCMIMAPPGTGKTRLANKLAQAESFNFLRFNLTHLYNREQLLDVFDRISTEQAKRPEEPLLVFVDEINTRVGHDYVYSAFLSPLEDGIYVRAEKIFHIEPCFWVFAGTKEVGDENSNKIDQPNQDKNKWSDFRSRLTLPDINFDRTISQFKKLETVYIGSSMLVTSFPDVRWVSEKVLTLFWLLGDIKDLRMRQLIQFVRSFKDIQRGIVNADNVMIEWLAMQDINWAKKPKDPVWTEAEANKIIDVIPDAKNDTNSERWQSLDEGDFVKIEL
jgi:ATPase family associated with various cellular activities (AAA)